MSNELEEFGKIFIENVRDRTISDTDMSIDGKYNDVDDLTLAKTYSHLDIKSQNFIKQLIPEIVDLCLFNFLDMFEQNDEIELNLNGKNLAQESDGLAGELYTEDGWIQKFSNERYSDK